MLVYAWFSSSIIGYSRQQAIGNKTGTTPLGSAVVGQKSGCSGRSVVRFGLNSKGSNRVKSGVSARCILRLDIAYAFSESSTVSMRSWLGVIAGERIGFRGMPDSGALV